MGPLRLPTTYTEDFTAEHVAQLHLSDDVRINTEEVIVECLRNNYQLCQDSIPNDLIEELGILMDKEKDITDCMQMEAFLLMCLPKGHGSKAISRNQERVLDVLLSDALINVKRTIHRLFFIPKPTDQNNNNNRSYSINEETISGEIKVKYPDRLISLLSATICKGNRKAARQLESKPHIDIEATLDVLERVLKSILRMEDMKLREKEEKLKLEKIEQELKKRKEREKQEGTENEEGIEKEETEKEEDEGATADDVKDSEEGMSNKEKEDKQKAEAAGAKVVKIPLLFLLKSENKDVDGKVDQGRERSKLHSLIELLCHQLETLVVDPKIFLTDMDKTWQFVTVTCRNLLAIFASVITQLGPDQELPPNLLHVTHKATKCAVILLNGARLGRLLDRYQGELLSKDGSLYRSAFKIYTSTVKPSKSKNANAKDAKSSKNEDSTSSNKSAGNSAGNNTSKYGDLHESISELCHILKRNANSGSMVSSSESKPSLYGKKHPSQPSRKVIRSRHSKSKLNSVAEKKSFKKSASRDDGNGNVYKTGESHHRSSHDRGSQDRIGGGSTNNSFNNQSNSKYNGGVNGGAPIGGEGIDDGDSNSASSSIDNFVIGETGEREELTTMKPEHNKVELIPWDASKKKQNSSNKIAPEPSVKKDVKTAAEIAKEKEVNDMVNEMVKEVDVPGGTNIDEYLIIKFSEVKKPKTLLEMMQCFKEALVSRLRHSFFN